MSRNFVVALMLFGGCAASLLCQEKAGNSVWDGVYTDQQAARGETGYSSSCASCHGKALEGRGQTPPLAGSDFTANWNGRPLDDLFEKIQDSMPADRPGQLSRPQNAAVLAYILKSNKFPAGSAELSTEADALKRIRFDAERPAR